MCEASRILNRDLRQDLSVQFDAGLLEPEDELVVAESVLTCSSSDANNPEPAEIPLSRSPVAVRVLEGAIDRFARELGQPALAQVISFCALQNLASTCGPLRSSFNSWHFALTLQTIRGEQLLLLSSHRTPSAANGVSLSVRKHLPYRSDIGAVHRCRLGQLTLEISVLLRKDVPGEGMPAPDLSRPRKLESLPRTTMSFEFVHVRCFVKVIRRRPVTDLRYLLRLSRSKNGDEIIAFHAWPVFNPSDFVQFVDQALDQSSPDFFVNNLASAKPDVSLHLITLFQETDDVVLLEFVIVFVGVGPKLDLLDRDALLMLTGIVGLAFHLVEVFPIVHDPADRRTSVWSNLYEIQASFLS